MSHHVFLLLNLKSNLSDVTRGWSEVAQWQPTSLIIYPWSEKSRLACHNTITCLCNMHSGQWTTNLSIRPCLVLNSLHYCSCLFRDLPMTAPVKVTFDVNTNHFSSCLGSRCSWQLWKVDCLVVRLRSRVSLVVRTIDQKISSVSSNAHLACQKLQCCTVVQCGREAQERQGLCM